jgi:hypothetical protein
MTLRAALRTVIAAKLIALKAQYETASSVMERRSIAFEIVDLAVKLENLK